MYGKLIPNAYKASTHSLKDWAVVILAGALLLSTLIRW